MTTRRNFLKQASLLSTAAVLPNVFPEAIQRALAINPALGTTFYDAEHIVFLMQENRSFDHMFGTLKGVRGFNDPHPHILPNQDKVWLQRDAKGNAYSPFHIDLNSTKVTWQGGLPHSWPDQIAARNDGKYDKWVPAKSVMSLAYYKRKDLPFYYALVDAFTVCDHHFCSSLTGTTPNRLFYWTGNIRPNPNDKSLRPVVSNYQAESHTNRFVDWPTFPELLEDNGIDWRVYQNEIWTAKLPGETDDWLGNYGDNALEYVKRHRVKLSAYFRENGDKTVTPNLSAEEVLAQYNALSEREKKLIDKAFTTNINAANYLDLVSHSYENEAGKRETLNVPKGDIFYQFRKDVNEGKLPTVSWLVAPQRFSDHTSSPLYGTWYVSEALNILTQNPEVWKKTIFIVNYDENDGYYDHMPPFVAPKPNTTARGKVSAGIDTASDYEANEGSPIGLGFRVPMIVASPWSRGGFVNSQIFDHTSTLMFLEDFLKHKTGKQLKSEQISTWRRAVCGNMTSVFRPYHGEPFKTPNALIRNEVIEHIQKVKHKPKQERPHSLKEEDILKINRHHAFEKGSSALMAAQERGTKPACALPYYLTVNARLNETRTSVVLDFATSDKSFGAPFNVSALNTYSGERGRNWYMAVKANDYLEDNWEIAAFANGKYDLSVHGPNGFYRRFSGSKADPNLLLKCLPAQQGVLLKDTGNLQLYLENNETHSLELVISDPFYKVNGQTVKIKARSKKIISLNLKKYHHWYNFFITVKGFENYKTHYAGHVETGKESITDPYMGGVL
ncbi:phosphocholine-specific phospholipase C [Pedobacter sp. UBA4863]|uniref:phosphocholine-specific phospholipase C n=1 Tax=Pedobacter sp. UBA4863 TaxID=1947060 RepID=UPI0025DBC096|nr:phospholipase C, phosphocholine-specific [Pedobacter sp. UBA4863]